MAHVENYKMTAVKALCNHFERFPDENGRYVCFQNMDINAGRTHMNYNLAPVREKGQAAFVKERLSEVEHLNRNNLNVMSAWVITLPKGFPAEKEFFRETYNFMANRYGEENIISAYVHKDEYQPHMHFAFVPVKDNRLAASKVIDITELKSFHPELKLYLEEKLGQEVPVLNGETIRGMKTVAELKAARAMEKANEITKKAEVIITETKAEIESLSGQKKSLQDEISLLHEKLLSEKEIKELKASKGITGSLKGITYDDYEALVNTARYAQEIQAENEDLKVKLAEANKRAAEAEKAAKKALTEKPSIALLSENGILKARLENMENRLFLLSENIPERYKRNIENILNNQNPFFVNRYVKWEQKTSEEPL